MERNCRLDLRLSPYSATPPVVHKNPMVDPLMLSQQEQITICYNGRMSICDLTELQAKAVIWLASREMEERNGNDRRSSSSSSSSSSSKGDKMALLSLDLQLYGPPGLSMKRSLQRFLQKRKNRAQAVSPYSN